MRDIDSDVQTQLESVGRTDLVLVFLTVNDPAHPDIPIRLVCEENGNISHNAGFPINYYLLGNLHYGFPFRFSRLTDDDRPARATLNVPAFDRRIVQWFRDMVTPARLTAALYSAAAWDDEVDSFNARDHGTTINRIYFADKMWLRNVSAGGIEIVCELGGYDFTQEPLGKRATQDLCPDLFR